MQITAMIEVVLNGSFIYAWEALVFFHFYFLIKNVYILKGYNKKFVQSWER